MIVKTWVWGPVALVISSGVLGIGALVNFKHSQVRRPRRVREDVRAETRRRILDRTGDVPVRPGRDRSTRPLRSYLSAQAREELGPDPRSLRVRAGEHVGQGYL